MWIRSDWLQKFKLLCTVNKALKSVLHHTYTHKSPVTTQQGTQKYKPLNSLRAQHILGI